jgi:hypothetical protein
MAVADSQCVPLKQKLRKKYVIVLAEKKGMYGVQTLPIVETSLSKIRIN